MSGSGLVGLSGCLAIIYLIYAPGANAQPAGGGAAGDCRAVWSRLFAPPRPQIGRYQVCAEPVPLHTLAPPEWTVELVGPLDAFGRAGRFDRRRLSQAYGGVRASVARGIVQRGDSLESVTLISPHPDATLTHLLPGTLVIRHIVPR